MRLARSIEVELEAERLVMRLADARRLGVPADDSPWSACSSLAVECVLMTRTLASLECVLMTRTLGSVECVLMTRTLGSVECVLSTPPWSVPPHHSHQGRRLRVPKPTN